ncbi:hypothetical protein CEXT_762841 [Caerostris extrusa]|uniref:Uncharacterized protein n=1 Tax=Caerostris extrusa TaxID=172846 RepID=A0AAV4S520_CAEEX|nr:hypothetical protein CEXT_762841 [Caerostris extrusa]
MFTRSPRAYTMSLGQVDSAISEKSSSRTYSRCEEEAEEEDGGVDGLLSGILFPLVPPTPLQTTPIRHSGGLRIHSLHYNRDGRCLWMVSKSKRNTIRLENYRSYFLDKYTEKCFPWYSCESAFSAIHILE